MKNLTLKKVFYFVPVAMTLFTVLFFLTGHERIKIKLEDTDALMGFIAFAVIALFFIVMYCIHIYKNQRIEKQEKRLWYAGIILSSGIVSTVYYFVHIFKEGNK